MTALPFHTTIIIWLIISSMAACFLLCAGGFIWKHTTRALPPVPLFPGSTFPNLLAYIYTAFFIVFFSSASIQSCKMPAEPVNPVEMVQGMMIQIAVYVPFLLIYFTLPRRAVPVSNFVQKVRWIFSALAFLIIFSFLTEAIGLNRWLIDVTGCPVHQDVVVSIQSGSPVEKIIMSFMAVVVAPITEECCFRGFIYNILKQQSGRILAILASSLFFAAVHSSIPHLLPLFVFAVIQCIAYEKARSLWLPVTIHFLFNLLNVLLILFCPSHLL